MKAEAWTEKKSETKAETDKSDKSNQKNPKTENKSDEKARPESTLSLASVKLNEHVTYNPTSVPSGTTIFQV